MDCAHAQVPRPPQVCPDEREDPADDVELLHDRVPEPRPDFVAAGDEVVGVAQTSERRAVEHEDENQVPDEALELAPS
eukprot:15430818-Alexandrium_andersonii.AAC.1